VGITSIHVDFDGEGDSGQINGVLALAGDQPGQLPATKAGRITTVPKLGDLFAGCQQAKIAGLLQGSECEVTIAILTDDDSPVNLIGTGPRIK